MTSSVIETIETQAHRIVNYKDGILRVYSKPSHIELDDVMALLDTFAKLHDDDRLLVLIDPTEENSMSMEARAYIRKQMKNHIRCLAVVGRKKFVRSLFKIISSFVDIGLEMKIFEKEEEAVKWLLEKITD